MKIITRSTRALAIGVLVFSSGCSKNDVESTSTEGSKEIFASLNKMMATTWNVQLSSDPDNDFAILSAIQSETIIDLAKKELQFGNNERMKTMARDLIETRSWDLKQYNTINNLHLPHAKMPECGKQMISNFDQAEKNIHLMEPTGDINKDFAAVLIFLNQAVVENAQLASSKGDVNLLKSLCERVSQQQSQEIRYLQAWLLGNKNPD